MVRPGAEHRRFASAARQLHPVVVLAALQQTQPVVQHNLAVRLLGAPQQRRRLHPRPYSPRTNGKAERFIQTMLRDWADARAYLNSAQCTAHLPVWLPRHNWHRPHQLEHKLAHRKRHYGATTPDFRTAASTRPARAPTRSGPVALARAYGRWGFGVRDAGDHTNVTALRRFVTTILLPVLVECMLAKLGSQRHSNVRRTPRKTHLRDSPMTTDRPSLPKSAGVEAAARSAVRGLVGLLMVLLVPAKSADGYRFMAAYTPDQPEVQTAETALRWDPTIWPLGSPLSWWVVADDSQPGFEDVEEALPYVASALNAWSSPDSAEIAWEVIGLADGPPARDGRNTLHFDGAGRARVWIESGRIVECDASVGTVEALLLQSRRDRAFGLLLHEIGHCLGLLHTAWAPLVDAGQHALLFSGSGLFDQGPVMGTGYPSAIGLTVDDTTAASLLRPAHGWLEGQGTVSGRVTRAGRAARLVLVWAHRLSDGRFGRGVGSFSDLDGNFIIEGLDPGEYLIRASPMLKLACWPDVIRNGVATLDVSDTTLLEPVMVHSARDTHGVLLDMRPRGQSTPWVQ